MIVFSLIRHARTRWNLEKRLQGRTDLPLCPQGEADARTWAERLAGLCFDRILTSPLARAGQTAKIIGDRLEIETVIDEDLAEQDFGLWEGRTIKELRRSCPDELARLESLGWEFRPPQGESRTQVLTRGLRSLVRAERSFETRNLLVVTHNTLMKCLVYHGLGRGFLPNEPEVLTPFHLHGLEWDGAVKCTDLNKMSLMEAPTSHDFGSDKKEGAK